MYSNRRHILIATQIQRCCLLVATKWNRACAFPPTARTAKTCGRRRVLEQSQTADELAVASHAPLARCLDPREQVADTGITTRPVTTSDSSFTSEQHCSSDLACPARAECVGVAARSAEAVVSIEESSPKAPETAQANGKAERERAEELAKDVAKALCEEQLQAWLEDASHMWRPRTF